MSFDYPDNHINCFAHIINLSVNQLLPALDTSLPDSLLEDETSFETENVVKKLRKLIRKIRCSSQRREYFSKSCNFSNIKACELIIDVKICWIVAKSHKTHLNTVCNIVSYKVYVLYSS